MDFSACIHTVASLNRRCCTINFMFLSIASQWNACLRVVHLVSTNWMPLHCCIEFMVYSFVIYTFAPGASRFALIISWMNWRTHISSTIPNVLACALSQHCFSAFLLHHPSFCVYIAQYILYTTIHPIISMENFVWHFLSTLRLHTIWDTFFPHTFWDIFLKLFTLWDRSGHT